MIRSPWRLDGNTARLDAPMLQGKLSLDRPQEGLREIVLGGTARRHDTLLSLVNSPADLHIAEGYVRGGDLVATYAESRRDKVRPQIYWRSQMAGEAEPSGGVEMVISMQTSLLDSDPALATESVLPVGEVLWLDDAETGRFRLITAGEFPTTGAGLILVRPAGEAVSYCGAVFPGDYLGGEWQLKAGGGVSRMGLRFRLFGERLEKGVIRRVRVWCGYVPRQDDERLALAIRRDWLAQPLPLTT